MESYSVSNRIIVSFCMIGFLTGCATARDAYMVDSLTKEGKEYNSINPSSPRGDMQVVPPPFDLDEDRFPESQKEDENGEASQPAYLVALKDKTERSRNRLMDYLVKRSNIICEAHKASILSNAATANFSLGSVTSVLTGLGAIFTPVSTVRALSGSAAIVNATRSEFNNVFYQNLLSTAIVKSIEEKRTEKYSELASRRSEKKDTYSVDEMLSDVIQYHELCSFFTGLVTLTDAAARVTESGVELNARLDSINARLSQNKNDLKSATGDEADQLKSERLQLFRERQQVSTQLSLTRSVVPPSKPK